MIRNAFVMKLKPGFEAEYKKRHDAIWPELSRELKRAGISDYSIFLDQRTLTLFAVQNFPRIIRRRHAGNGNRAAVVGVYGGYYGNKSGSFAGRAAIARGVLDGVRRKSEVRSQKTVVSNGF